MLDKLTILIALAGMAVVFADVLVRPGMLLEPVQRWLRLWWRTWRTERLLRYVFKNEAVPNAQEIEDTRRGLVEHADNYGLEIDSRWWWPPLWGCYKCVAGQWGFWGYLIRYHAHYNFFEHLAFTAFTIIAAIIISKWTQE
jgi:hypothetical protein